MKALLALAAVSLVLALIRAALTGSAIDDPEVLASVEGRLIPAKLYRMYLENGVEALGLDQNSAEDQQKLELLKEGIVSELIDRALIEVEAERRGLSATEAELEAACQAEFARMGGRQASLAHCLRHGITEQEFRALVRQQLLAQLLREQLSREVSVTDEEVRDFYNREKRNPKFASLMIEPERVRARHILIEARPNLIEAEFRRESLSRDELKKKVEGEMRRRLDRAFKILGAIRRGADFGLMARLHSDDLGTRDRGGDLGLFDRRAHTARFDEVAFGLKPGQVSQPIQTEYGYHIIQVLEHRPARERSLEEVSAQIREHLLSNKRAAHLRAWLEARRRRAEILINPLYRFGQLRDWR